MNQRSVLAVVAFVLAAGLLCIDVVATVGTLPVVFAIYGPHSISHADIQASHWLMNNSPEGSKVGVFGFDFWDYWIQYYSQRPAIQAAEGARYLEPDSTAAQDEQQGQLLTQVSNGRFSLENGVVKASDWFYSSGGRPSIFLNLGEYQEIFTVNDSQVSADIAGNQSGSDRNVPLSSDRYSILNATGGSSMQSNYSGLYFAGTKTVTLNESAVLIDYKLSSNNTIDSLDWKLGLGPMLEIASFQSNSRAINATLLSNETGNYVGLKINLKGPGILSTYVGNGRFSANLTSINANNADFQILISFNGPYYGTPTTGSFSDSCLALNQLGLNYVYIRTLIYPERYYPILDYLGSSQLFSPVYAQNGVYIFKVLTEKCAIGA